MSLVPYENPDLKRERQNCSFDKEEITSFIDGGKERTKDRRELGFCQQPVPFHNHLWKLTVEKYLETYILSDPQLKDQVPVEYLSHAERYETELRKACLLLQKVGDSPAGQVQTLR